MSEDVVRSAFNDQNTLIITHLLHLLPLNARLGPVFLDKPRDWQCIGIHWIQRNSGTWACRNPSQVNHSSLNRTRRELQQYLFCFWHLKQNESTKTYHISSTDLDKFLQVPPHILTRCLETMSNLKYHPLNADTKPLQLQESGLRTHKTTAFEFVWLCTL